MNASIQSGLRERVARLGLLAFAFFLVKGMAWLVASWVLVRGVT
ncbi:MAG: hypothetical protein OEW35_00515 [Gammaproteobacteria bacterium]|nr:hypothetical protein [Gammaproteobacteria bacterium]MDH4254647.1 hypothetical protein [Gammaproteobacteria bacterium]MDH5308330.1 hypothetical protein [Gammaproteobacteria bacterium]